jgi:hypothetical protein
MAFSRKELKYCKPKGDVARSLKYYITRNIMILAVKDSGI